MGPRIFSYGSARATEISTEFVTAGTFHGEIHNTLGWDAKYEEMQITLTVGCLSVKEKFVHLGNKFSQGNHAPRTIIGKDYMSEILTRRNAADKHYGHPRIKKVDLGNEEERETVLSVAYGPFYCVWAGDMLRGAKEEAWNHVLRSSEGNEIETSRLYFEVVSRVKNEARALYGIGPGSIDYLPNERFIWMMIIDGCFLLQVALLVLGGSKQLNKNRSCCFPFICEEGRPELLEVDKVSTIRRAVSSMFVVGNQIPLLVLRALMRQSFFKKVVNGGIWEQPMDLERWVLFELLLAPALLDVGGGGGGISIPTASLHSFFSRVSRQPWTLISHSRLIMLFIEPFKRKNDPSKKASDLLHGLWLLTTAGLSDHSKDDDVGKDLIYYEGEDDHERSYDAVLPTVRSATELKEVGVVFQYKEGINEIRFKKVMFNALLILPRIVMDSEKEMFTLFSNLIRYEVIQFGQSRRKVCEYLRLMRGLIRSTEDAKILTAKGIIVVDPNQEEKVPLLFQGLQIPRVTRSHSGTLRNITDELNNYTNPNVFKKLGFVLNIVIWTAGEEFTAAGRRRKGRRSEVGRPPESRSPERRLPVAGVEVAGRRSDEVDR
ncbi:Protein of unknown function DUF247 [Macleaya cordata]|uniref:Uncharacterized protein n=1 Tax=Macleaya cordata TaxID=56857 RepID=A0A200QLG5_MACCD|nr:Protein of unknown function DUF247 [Macleaya cordata]